MRKTEILGLPIYDTPETDLFKFHDWNEGNEKIDENIKKLITTEAINTIYVEANGSDSNDGFSQDKAVKTLARAFYILSEIGSKSLFKQWRIKIGTGSFAGVRVQSLPLFTKPLLIEGDGTELTVIEKKADEQCGIWIEPGKGVAVTISKIKFKDFEVGFNGYGVLMKNHGYLLVQDCEAVNCDCGFAGVNNVTLTVQRSIMRDCSYGARNQYNGSATLGAGTGGGHLSDGGNGCEVYNCEVGMLITRNSVAHNDYVKFFNCGIGTKVEMNSRVATLGCVYDTCGVGVDVYGGAEWIGGTDTEVDTFTNCTIPYDLKGFGRYTRLQSLYCKSESLFFTKIQTDLPNGTIQNSTTKTEVFRSSPSSEALPVYYLDRNTKVKVVIRGEYKSASAVDIKIDATLRGLNEDNTVNSKDIPFSTVTIKGESSGFSGFVCETEIVFTPTNHQRNFKLERMMGTSPSEIRILTYNTGIKANTEGKKQLMVYVTNGDATQVTTIKQIDMYIMN